MKIQFSILLGAWSSDFWAPVSAVTIRGCFTTPFKGQYIAKVTSCVFVCIMKRISSGPLMAGQGSMDTTTVSRATQQTLRMGCGTVTNVFSFLWSLKSVFLLPWDIYTDVRLAETHFRNGNQLWGTLTVIFLTPSLLFPYYYYQILRYVQLKYKYLFGQIQEYTLETMIIQSKPSEAEVGFQEKKKISCDGIFAYLEDIPQFILQVYILWKTPSQCFSLESTWNIEKVRTFQSILTSFLSIAAHVVPFYEKRRNEKWELLSKTGFFFHFFSGVFLNMMPKLILISWTFSVLKWYGWLFVSALFLLSGILILVLFRKEPLKSKLLLSVQITFGYVGGKRGFVISALILACFLFPLGISLNAAKIASFEQELDSFDFFPYDQFPSRTICFTNSSIIEQHEKWFGRNITFSDKCNLTYNAVPCVQVEKELIITQLCLMIGAMSAGPSVMIIMILGGITSYYLTKLIRSCIYKIAPPFTREPSVRRGYEFPQSVRLNDLNIQTETESNQESSRSENINQNSLTDYLKDLFDFV